jgi:hypothetical protein
MRGAHPRRGTLQNSKHHVACCCCCYCQVVHVPNRGIWGTAGIDGANIDTGIANDGDYLKVISCRMG